MNELENLEPKRLWKHFYDLTQVPHPSYHLEKMQQHLLEFGKKIGVETILDEAGNVILRKPATPGQEHRKGIVMQAHMDMVPQKRKGCDHDFLTDPLKPYVDGEWVRATDTTLGADDGMGVAAAMAIMEDDTLVHGPLEALFTVNEETGLEGAFGLKEDALKGSYLLNMDSEDEGEFTVGCAGGLNIFASMEYKPEVADVTDKAFKISLAGLYGGHSGMEIGTGRGNANKMMARVVYDAIAECDAELAEWHGGNMHNAIPRECEAIVTVPAGNEEAITSLVADYQAQFNEEYKGVESNIKLTIEAVEMPKEVVPEEIRDNIVSAILACFNGVHRYIPEMPEVPETSSNLAIVNLTASEVRIELFARSAVDSMKRYVAIMIESCFSMAGMKVETEGDYSGWSPKFDSALLETAKKVYKDLSGKDAIVNVTHGGLECGLIGSKYPEMDMVSFGPTLRSPHTPDERCHIPSVARFYDLVRKLVETL